MATMENVGNRRNIYHVFLSFRGLDTRYVFTDYLYKTLRETYLFRTFRDDEGLERGETLSPQLEDAIKRSQISIIVFSQTYATSAWCLDELLLILERKRNEGHKVIPVFYKVDPTHVRFQTESFKEALDLHLRRADKYCTDDESKAKQLDKIQAWKKALKEAADLSGWHFVVDHHEYVTDFIQKIVSDVKKKLMQGTKHVSLIEDHLVKINERAKELISWLKEESITNNTTVFVLYGMGGIGKTTIADYVFRSYSEYFDDCCFLGKIREISERKLCSRLFSGLNRTNHPKWKYPEDLNNINQYLSFRRVLIVLDDVAEVKQLDALQLQHLKFCEGSKIIITTRHKLSLGNLRTEGHKVEFLDDDDALKLFRQHAFGKDHNFKEDSTHQEHMKIVHRCGNLPLPLEVLGSSLRGITNVEIWKSILERLHENPDIQDVLLISYDSLRSEKDRRVFLLIACFFLGRRKEEVIKILSDCYLEDGTKNLITSAAPAMIKNLIDRCLITIAYDKTLEMHQLLQDMAGEIIRKESPYELGKRSILFREDSFNVLKNEEGTKKVQALVLNMEDMGKEEKLEFDAFTGMTNLTFLKLEHVYLEESCSKFPKKLRWICWENCLLNSLPIHLPLDNLSHLAMHRSKLINLFDGYKVLRSLKFLDLSDSESLLSTPDFGGLPKLESLILCGCVRLRKIPLLPDSVVSLDISRCEQLTVDSFPTDTFSNPLSLKTLDISDTWVTRLPDCFTNLPRLTQLRVDGCPRLQSIICLKSTGSFILSAHRCRWLEIVKAPIKIESSFDGCQNLREVEGSWFKWAPAGKVDNKVLRSLGIESLNLLDEIKVLYEYDYEIYSTYFEHYQAPNYVKCGTSIRVLTVPTRHNPPNNHLIAGLNVCFVWRQKYGSPPDIQVRTKDVNWSYRPVLPKFTNYDMKKKFMWVSMWKCGGLFEGGDVVEVQLITMYNDDDVEEWGVRMVYGEELLDTNNITYTSNDDVEELEEGKLDFHSSNSFNTTGYQAQSSSSRGHMNSYARHEFFRRFLPRPACIGVFLGQLRAGRVDKKVDVLIKSFQESYNEKNPNELMSHDLVLADEQGGMMHCCITSNFVAQFNELLCEGKFYSIENFIVDIKKEENRVPGLELCILFDSDTIIKEKTAPLPKFQPVPRFRLASFRELEDITQFYSPVFADIIGVIIGTPIQEMKIDGTTVKSEIVDLLDTEKNKIRLILQGRFTGLIHYKCSIGTVDEQIVIVKWARVEMINGKLVASDASKIHINFDVPEVLAFRNKLYEEYHEKKCLLNKWEEDFTKKRKTLSDVDNKGDNDVVFYVEATVKAIDEGNASSYTTCRYCFQNLKVDDHLQVVCGCSIPTQWRAERYPFDIWLTDETGSEQLFVLYDDDAAKIVLFDDDDAAKMISKLEFHETWNGGIRLFEDQEPLWFDDNIAETTQRKVNDFARQCLEDNSAQLGIPYPLQRLIKTKHKFKVMLEHSTREGASSKTYTVNKVFDEYETMTLWLRR